jgi:hypothetical protein
MTTKWAALALLLGPNSQSVSCTHAFSVPNQPRVGRIQRKLTPISLVVPSRVTSTCLWMDPREGNVADWTLTALIVALDDQGIRYLPTATRRELEDLLSNAAAGSPNPISAEKNGMLSLQELIAELDERSIRYKPTATRAELEAMLSNYIDVPKETKPNASMPILNETVESTPQKSPVDNMQTPHTKLQSITSLLAELDARGIRYPPTSTRAELEALLVAQKQNTGNPQKKISITALLDELDRRDLRYPPDASRAELDALLHKSNRSAPRTPEGAEQQRRRRRRRRQQQNQPNSSIGQLLSISAQFAARTAKELPRRVSKIKNSNSLLPGRFSQTVARQVKRVSRKVDDFLMPEDDDGIREPIWYYSAVDADINVDDESVSDQPRPQGTRTRPVRVREPPLPEPRPTARVRVQPMYQLLGRPMDDSRFSESNSYGKAPRDATQQKKKPRPQERRIYSPYGQGKTSAFDLDGKDAVDRFGDFVADRAEELLWGPDTNARDDKKSRQPKSVSKARYWKDRIEEQLDYALGLHDDSEPYTSWEEIKMGKQGIESGPKRHGKQSRSGKKRTNGDIPVWEEEGNMVSLLFGRRPSGGQLALERFMDQELGSKFLLVTFFRSVAKGILTLSSYTCRWASVKGALPQPIVVLGAITAALCARPRHRLSTVFLTLLAMRTVGELLHGYVNNGWDEMDYSETDDEDGDVTDGDSSSAPSPTAEE